MISSFEDNKFYISCGRGENWSDYDGPFNDIIEAVYFLEQVGGRSHASPELGTSVLCHFKDNQLDLVKDDNNMPINGVLLQLNDSVVYKNNVVWRK